MASKSADAFRTISEVADWLDTPTHVLRFWETKFSQIRPVKRAGGRRYYRPSDMELLGGIKKLLHEDGLTIRGVQKILREQGVKHVQALCDREIEDKSAPARRTAPKADPVDQVTATVVPLRPGAAIATPQAEDDAPENLFAADDSTAPLLFDDLPTMTRDAQGDENSDPDLSDPALAQPAPPALPGASPAPSAMLPAMRDMLRGTDRARLRTMADRLAPPVARLVALRQRLAAEG